MHVSIDVPWLYFCRNFNLELKCIINLEKIIMSTLDYHTLHC